MCAPNGVSRAPRAPFRSKRSIRGATFRLRSKFVSRKPSAPRNLLRLRRYFCSASPFARRKTHFAFEVHLGFRRLSFARRKLTSLSKYISVFAAPRSRDGKLTSPPKYISVSQPLLARATKNSLRFRKYILVVPPPSRDENLTPLPKYILFREPLARATKNSLRFRKYILVVPGPSRDEKLTSLPKYI